MQFDSVTPIYVQIAEDIRKQILAGTLREGDQVMSTTAYATTYRINPATAAKAFAQLTDDGLLEKRRGIGMFVAAGARQTLRQVGRAAYYSEVLNPALDQAKALGLSEQEIHDHVTTQFTAWATPGKE
ncbi:MAG: GntR family transcriptional regulator [Buchananella hordeovulneris]|nr:GntR family transcriptional regulator [Buchananella hordeovulneris]